MKVFIRNSPFSWEWREHIVTRIYHKDHTKSNIYHHKSYVRSLRKCLWSLRMIWLQIAEDQPKTNRDVVPYITSSLVGQMQEWLFYSATQHQGLRFFPYFSFVIFSILPFFCRIPSLWSQDCYSSYQYSHGAIPKGQKRESLFLKFLFKSETFPEGLHLQPNSLHI